VIRYDDAGGKKESVHTEHTLFTALLLLSWHSIKKYSVKDPEAVVPVDAKKMFSVSL
jgi:hypothetical protein